MKIATFNINNVNKRLPNLLDWLEAASPDVVCLQELKAEDRAFPADALAKVGYSAVWKGQKSWNGVAILSHGQAPILTRTGLPGDPSDNQSRYIAQHAPESRISKPGIARRPDDEKRLLAAPEWPISRCSRCAGECRVAYRSPLPRSRTAVDRTVRAGLVVATKQN